MKTNQPADVTKLLLAWNNGDSAALDNLIAMGAVERGERDPGGAYTWSLPHRHRSKPKKRRAA